MTIMIMVLFQTYEYDCGFDCEHGGGCGCLAIVCITDDFVGGCDLSVLVRM